MNSNKKSNRLINEKSPYLLQHAYNPVNWFPWCDEAFEKAKAEDKPIFLSIGYSTCHWCHVMERESFEDEEVAGILNRHFISIKVDREERPDIDNIYMSVCQALTGQGGWPLTIIMTTDKKPFYAGTYFPKNDMVRMPGLISILNDVVEAWKRNKDAIIDSGNRIIAAISSENKNQVTTEIDIVADIDIDNNGNDFAENEQNPAVRLTESDLDGAYLQLKRDFDNSYGGFGRAPKFPTPHNLYFLLRYWHKTGETEALEMVEKTLDAMQKGGIYDHIGFGFSRYSTDRKWLVPHFEKMLYDNALLAIAYLEAYQATGKYKYSRTAEQIFTYVLRDMTSPEGGFYSAEDADSEGVEGKFYVWDKSEIKEILGSDAAQKFCSYFNVAVEGNFEGRNILNRIDSEAPNQPEKDTDFINQCREKLFAYREKRMHPYKDDKILTAWNGLMAAALAIGGRVLKNEKYTMAAEKSIQFVFDKLVRYDGRLLARYRDGDAAIPAFADDYAFLIWSLIELYETTFKAEYLLKAIKLNRDMLKLFWDEKDGGFFLYGTDSEQLIMRPKDIYDGALPSGNSVAALNLLKLSRLTGDVSLEEKAEKIFMAFGESLKAYPRAYTFALLGLMFKLSPTQEVVIVSDKEPAAAADGADKMLDIINRGFRPFTTTLFYYSGKGNKTNVSMAEIVSFLADYTAINGKTTAYVCRNYTCQAPVTDVNEFEEQLM